MLDREGIQSIYFPKVNLNNDNSSTTRRSNRNGQTKWYLVEINVIALNNVVCVKMINIHASYPNMETKTMTIYIKQKNN